MGNQYQFTYSDQTPYANAWHLVSQLNQPKGVHLDIGAGYGAISEKVSEFYTYVGIDGDAEAVSFLKEKGLEAYCHVFGDRKKDTEFLRLILDDRQLAQVTILDMLEHLTDPAIVLSPMHEIMLESNVPLIISVPNISHQDVALKLLGGDFDYTETGLLDKTHVSFYTENHLSETMNSFGFIQTESFDFHLGKSDQHFPKDNTLLSDGSKLSKYLKLVKSLADPYATVNQFIRSYLPVKQNTAITNEEDSRPFLTIIMRTQGNRQKAMQESLLSLVAQSNTDFELLIMAHMVTQENLDALHSTIEATPIWLQRKSRIVTVDFGNRTAPLNEGFKMAKGKYIAIFDDDDILFDNWVEAFYNLSQTNDGRVLHSYAASQQWESITGNRGTVAFRACGIIDNVYCRDFNYIAQLSNNFCPVMSLAFPAFAFQKMGIKFDETLTTTEDWDFLMRTVAICGVANSSEVTSLYRRWINLHNANTQHSANEWRRNYEQIRLKMSRDYLLLAPEDVSALFGILSADRYANINAAGHPTPMYTLYLDCGSGFSESEKRMIPADLSSSEIDLLFNNLVSYGPIRALRFDPTENQNIAVQNLSITIHFNNGSQKTFTCNEISSTGINHVDGVFFLFPDPQITIELTGTETIESVGVIADVTHELSPDTQSRIITYLQSGQFEEDGIPLFDTPGESFKLYFDKGKGYSEQLTMYKNADITEKNIRLRFDNLKKFKRINSVRFDPTELSDIVLENLSIAINYSDGSESILNLGQVNTNGEIQNGKILFHKPDPQIYIPINRRISLESITIYLSIDHSSI